MNTVYRTTPCVVFQQIEDLCGTIVGYEALGRMQHGYHECLSPTAFIQHMNHEELVDFDFTIAEQAIRDYAMRMPQFTHCWLSVNASKPTLQSALYANHLIEVTERHGVLPEEVTVEVLEECTDFFDDPNICRTLKHLAHAGFKIAIDDFPHWEHASTLLSWLSNHDEREIRVTKMKLDKSLIDDLKRGERIQETFEYVTLAHTCGMHVIAEGVEEREQVLQLSQLGADYLQGFYFGHPRVATESFCVV